MKKSSRLTQLSEPLRPYNYARQKTQQEKQSLRRKISTIRATHGTYSQEHLTKDSNSTLPKISMHQVGMDSVRLTSELYVYVRIDVQNNRILIEDSEGRHKSQVVATKQQIKEYLSNKRKWIRKHLSSEPT